MSVRGMKSTEVNAKENGCSKYVRTFRRKPKDEMDKMME